MKCRDQVPPVETLIIQKGQRLDTYSINSPRYRSVEFLFFSADSVGTYILYILYVLYIRYGTVRPKTPILQSLPRESTFSIHIQYLSFCFYSLQSVGIILE